MTEANEDFTMNSKLRRIGDKSVLSDGEKEIVKLVAKGHNDAEIGAKLFINEEEAVHSIHRVFEKLEVADRLEMVLYAVHCQLIGQP